MSQEEFLPQHEALLREVHKRLGVLYKMCAHYKAFPTKESAKAIGGAAKELIVEAEKMVDDSVALRRSH